MIRQIQCPNKEKKKTLKHMHYNENQRVSITKLSIFTKTWGSTINTIVNDYFLFVSVEDCNKAENMYLKVEKELIKLHTAYDSLATEVSFIPSI